MAERLDLGPHDELFDSAWLKWGQAIVHSQSLEADIDASRKDSSLVHSFTVRTEYHAKRHGFAIFLESIDPVPVRWSLRLADVANNFRSCLDHIAWAVVTRGRTPPANLARKDQRGIGFPVCKYAKEFKGSHPRMLPGARRADLARLRRYQPYQRAVSRQHLHCLTMLSAINNGNKHRTVQPVWAMPMTAEYEITDQRDCEVPTQLGRAFRNPLQVGVELGFLHARKRGPHPEIEVKAELTAEPFVEHFVMVKQWLYISKGWIFLLLLEFSRPPDQLLEIGIDLDTLRLDPADMPYGRT
jgi:hypothetical protein